MRRLAQSLLFLAVWPAVAGLLGVVAAPAARAAAFEGQEALGERGLELPKAGRWQAGARMHVTAARAILRGAVQGEVDAYTRRHPEAAEYERYLDDPQARRVRELVGRRDLAAVKRELKQALADRGKLGPDETAAIDSIDQKDLEVLDAVLDIRDPAASSYVVSAEPQVAWSSRRVRLSARAPLAFQGGAGGGWWRMGNLGVDARLGGLQPLGRTAIAGALGATLWLPTASSSELDPTRARLLETPALGGRWLGLAPYARGGIDLGWLEVITRAELVALEPVGAGPLGMRYGVLGAGVVIDARWLVLGLALDRMADLGNAPAMAGVWLAGVALRGRLGPVRVGIGAQLPFSPDDREAFGGIAGPWAQRAADLGVTVDVGGAW